MSEFPERASLAPLDDDHGTDGALHRLLRDSGTDVESARKWLRDALGCLEEPLDGCSVGNAENQASKALVALGRRDVWAPRVIAPLDDDHGSRRALLMQRLFSLADLLEQTSRDELGTLVTMNERISDAFMAHVASEDVYRDVFKAVAVGLAFLDHRDRQHAEAVKHS